ncbi:Coupling of ubiquitin conjugation to ER degradation protein 1 [Tolypocladium capitatum]|uniref:Coupling of ubiquitin conjugation to ER degradation protein 1 n=1 Tax=Tolypocladium capitatum TaxID=45235 RepID=A0A2K3QPA3_9HYPO|nr:Coupling of ubiquitin conjugation to ER degradation protein 1 [Tolypocladium capitatum]
MAHQADANWVCNQRCGGRGLRNPSHDVVTRSIARNAYHDTTFYTSARPSRPTSRHRNLLDHHTHNCCNSKAFLSRPHRTSIRSSRAVPAAATWPRENMANEQISLPYLAVILVVSGLIIRYLFFSGPPVSRSARSPEAFLRSREVAVERIQQMFPQAERRSILWDLQRNGGNIQNTTERILAGRLETPPITFQPPPAAGQAARSASSASVPRHPDKPGQPDLITRYNLKGKLAVAEGGDKKGNGWSSNRDERQASLQRRRDEMILAARRKMAAKIAAEKVAHGSRG